MEGAAVEETNSKSTSRPSDGRTVEECQDMINRSLKNPTVKFLREHMEKSGCTFGENFIKAVNCKREVSGGYTRGGGIIVCSNHMNLQDEVNQVVIHELIHAYDDCRAANLDWTNCAHHACSEIRAGHLSGDCHYKRELLRGFMKIRGHEQECVRRRVMKSLLGNPYCPEPAARDAMEAVWDTCYNDTKPFDRAP
ncbi:mitochondrial inner membrane protease ATP23 [Impatiens glandulifera]|uniref:mitochondrial inner membrane protease ATP23 n=1 Tax=Impatiens glandulifera TaxID=253017 RepID=UPI001FB066F6|nr:mitochondrial inner membrane protease ATP23 [Impatiens glandulifera]